LADFNATLLGRFDVVVLNDVDEIIVADPASGIPLLDALARAVEVGVITPFAVEVVHRFDLCPDDIESRQPILRQRPHVRINEVYAKPCITSVRLDWNLGGHLSDFPKLNLDPALYLFHLRYMDRAMLLDRQATRYAIAQAAGQDDPVVAGIGWTKSVEQIESFLRSLQAQGLPEDSDFRFDQKRRRISEGWRLHEPTGHWLKGRIFNRRRTYLVPERFRDLI
jgi:hypothetical protein